MLELFQVKVMGQLESPPHLGLKSTLVLKKVAKGFGNELVMDSQKSTVCVISEVSLPCT